MNEDVLAIPAVGDKIRTHFCTGIVEEVIDGSDRTFWNKTPYFWVKVITPRAAAGILHIVRADEVEDILLKGNA